MGLKNKRHCSWLLTNECALIESCVEAWLKTPNEGDTMSWRHSQSRNCARKGGKEKTLWNKWKLQGNMRYQRSASNRNQAMFVSIKQPQVSNPIQVRPNLSTDQTHQRWWNGCHSIDGNSGNRAMLELTKFTSCFSDSVKFHCAPELAMMELNLNANKRSMQRQRWNWYLGWAIPSNSLQFPSYWLRLPLPLLQSNFILQTRKKMQKRVKSLGKSFPKWFLLFSGRTGNDWTFSTSIQQNWEEWKYFFVHAHS